MEIFEGLQNYTEVVVIITAILLFFVFLSLLRKRKKPELEKKAKVPVEQPELAPPKEREKLVTLEEALQNTRKGFFGKIKGVFASQSEIPTGKLDEIEEVLYTSDLGPKTVQRFLGVLESSESAISLESIKNTFKSEMNDIFRSVNSHLNHLNGEKPVAPQIWMIVGVNGAGKTTTIGKLAHRLSQSGLKIMVAAGDTFRAAAKDQLQVWAERSGVEYFSPPGVDSPSAVAFDAVKNAIQKNVDILLIDTAGRLHTQSHLMEELKKIKRVITNQVANAPHEILIVLDANSGQNALVQARQFHEALGLTGVILTKLDGTAKGGVAIGVVNELRVPIKLIGVGEKVEDLRVFEAEEFIDSII